MSIGEVLNRLRPDFPDVSISKIRFLEAEGLIEPERTPSGYRKFSSADLERLRYILTAAARPLLPAEGHQGAPRRDGARPRAAGVAGETARAPRVVHAVPDESRRPTVRAVSGQRTCGCRAAELLASSGLDATTSSTSWCRSAWSEPAPRHATTSTPTRSSSPRRSPSWPRSGSSRGTLRAFKTAADREVGLIEQVVSPQSRQRDDQAQAAPHEMAAELAALSVRLHAALVKSRHAPIADRSLSHWADRRSRLDSVREVDVVGVRVEMPSNQPIVLLRESTGERYLPIWIGAVEATAIAFAQQGVVPPRPLTHDLLKDVLTATGHELAEVQITEVRDGVFYATLVLGDGIEVSARPSDSIALALRTGSRIVCSEEVLDEAGLAVPDDQEEEVEKFREFLDQISPEDFDAEQGQSASRADRRGAELSPSTSS